MTQLNILQKPQGIPAQEVELLAPAGCFASLQAGLDAGANAVYFGVAQLNMRARARRTFELADIAEIVQRCHAHNAHAYLALNTLMYDHDLRLVDRILDVAQEAGIDAVIVADVAVMQRAFERGIEVHLSTQLSVSNYESFKFYAKWCDRIVLARELSLPMIQKMHAKILADDLRGPKGRPLEIEAFAHGALCVAISGRCSMSLFTDNASANRGACMQNCRKEYIVTDADTGQQLKIDNNFVMSPNDISTLEFLDELLTSGIKVLKIEGRGRSPEYVFTVIQAYRKALDAIAEGTYSRESVQGMIEEMGKVYNRGFSSGYYLGRKQGWSETSGSKATRQKMEIGKVTHYYPKLGVAEITATAGKLKVGDEYVIIGSTTGVAKGTITEMRVDDGQTVAEIGPKMVFSIPVDVKVRPSDKLYLMRDITPA